MFSGDEDKPKPPSNRSLKSRRSISVRGRPSMMNTKKKSSNVGGDDAQSNRKKTQINKKAAKDADLNRKIIVKKLTKDAMRST